MQNRTATKVVCFATVLLIQCALCDSEAKALKEKSVNLERYGVSFRAPNGWFVSRHEKIAENIRKLDGAKEDIRSILASHHGSIVVATYSRYDPRGRAGVIPTINVLGRSNPHNTFEAFRDMIGANAHSMRSVLRNYVLKAAPTERTLAGRRVVDFTAEFEISTEKGGSYTVSSTTYAIPCGDIFLQVSMSESLPAKHSKVFEHFMGSFSFKEP